MAGPSASKTLQCQNLHDYLKTLDAGILDRLYNNPATCLAVFRELPEVARLFVMRLLFLDHPVPQAVVLAWVSKLNIKQHVVASSTLTELRIWRQASLPGGLPGWILNEVFKANFRTALVGGGSPWTMRVPSEDNPHHRDIAFLDKYALDRWECVLHYMADSHQQDTASVKDGISADAVRVLHSSGLMKSDDSSRRSAITREGFQFLLMDTLSQVWHFLLQYLATVESRGLDLVQCLGFLFQLSFSTLGNDYSTDGMTENLQIFLQHLREFGLVYQRKRRSGRFYPTRLAVNIASGVRQGSTFSTATASAGYIVVETNYRVYAYTDSQLQVALLALFTELMYRFPNLTVGILSRESVRAALKCGITADQILSFLRMHAHPIMRKTPPTLPPTISDQVKLWELERDRFRFTEGVLYSQFLSASDFTLLRDFAQDQGVLIWDNDSKRTMVVSRAGHDDVKKFWKRHSKGY